jgi:arginase
VKPVHVIGVPLDLGGGRRGVDMGPSAFRIAGLGERLARLGYPVVDHGNLPTPIPETQDQYDDRKKYILDIERICRQVYQETLVCFESGGFPLVLGGDHSLAAGSVAGAAQWARQATAKPLGLIWIDAHADMNTPATSPSGNVHGMVLAAALGLGGDAFLYDGWTLPAVEPGRIALVGVRSLDQGERELLGRLDAKVFTMSEVDRNGIEPCMREALAHVEGGNFLHVSLDMDVVDPEHAPGVGTPVRGGLNYREAHLAMEIVAEHGGMSSLDVVEVNPILDRENATGKLAVELVASALGARIL